MEQILASKNNSSYFFVAKMWHTENTVPVAEQQKCYTILSIVIACLIVTVNGVFQDSGYFTPCTKDVLVILLIKKNYFKVCWKESLFFVVTDALKLWKYIYIKSRTFFIGRKGNNPLSACSVVRNCIRNIWKCNKVYWNKIVWTLTMCPYLQLVKHCSVCKWMENEN